MTDQPAFAVVQLSTSFEAVWDDLANELGVRSEEVAADTIPSSSAFAIMLAAGGEEERGLDLLTTLRAPAGVPVYLVGAEPSHRFAIEAIRRGAQDFFSLPADLDLLRRTLAARSEAARERSAPVVGQSGDPFASLLGRSAVLQKTIDQARRVAEHGDVTVLIQGETGTGKELLARALHEGGPRAGRPFIAVNCAAIPSQLLESELFGHERGAFTDAHASKPGLFEEAHRGTLFLDEIGHLPIPLQGKLLRVLEEHRIRRVGATRSRDVDVRIIAATHVDLAAAAQRGEFREDLFYRLNIVALTLPPLRDRTEDLELLAEAFTASLAQRYRLPTPKLTPAILETLRGHSWPGNVRELRHAIERALLLSAAGSLDAEHLAPRAVPARPASNGAIPFPASLDRILSAAAQASLLQHGGNKSAAARALGISRARLQRLLDDEGDGK